MSERSYRATLDKFRELAGENKMKNLQEFKSMSPEDRQEFLYWMIVFYGERLDFLGGFPE